MEKISDTRFGSTEFRLGTWNPCFEDFVQTFSDYYTISLLLINRVILELIMMGGEFVTNLKEIKIMKLFGDSNINHIIPLNESGITFIHGPNGCGKTTILKLVSAFFNSDFGCLIDTRFEKMILAFNNNTLEIEQYRGIVRKELPDHEPIITKLVFTLNENKHDAFILVPSDLPTTSISPGDVDEYLPFMSRIGPREWIDRSTGEHYSFTEVLKMHGSKFPNLFLNIEKPAWLAEIQNSISLNFIKTQRLLRVNYPINRRQRNEEPVSSDVVQIYADQMKEIILKKLTEQATIAQNYDRSFPERLLAPSHRTDITETEIRAKYTETDKRIQKLVEAGLIDAQKNIPLPNKNLLDTERTVLSLYLEDVNQKLAVFNELQEKIQVFLEIVANKLGNKIFKVDRELGFRIHPQHNKEERLLPAQLSSGEQHQIVLFFELIFKAKPNTLFVVDEPEISLHVDWQRSFYNDIHKISHLGKHQFLIATHSPQVIGGHRELAISLGEGIL